MNKFMKKLCSLAMAGVCMSAVACSTKGGDNGNNDFIGFDEAQRVEDTRELSTNEFTILNTTGLDDFGNYSSSKDGIKSDRERYVGMFFFLTLGQHQNHYGIYDITEILKNHGREGFDANTSSSPVGAAHFWGEPLWGYYTSEDEWVLRKQVEMLTFMNVDYLVLDVSNAVLYEKVTSVLCNVLSEYEAMGWDIPKLMFYTHDYGGDSTKIIDNAIKPIKATFYDVEKYKNIWFKPEGKAMIVAHKSAEEALQNVDKSSPKYEEYTALNNYFHFKYWLWPTTHPGRAAANAFSWMEFTYPQPIHYEKERGDANGSVNVSVGQHPTIRFSDVNGTRGRGWTPKGGNSNEEFAKNLNLTNQWQTVLENDDKIKYVFITGWNEWVAEKMSDSKTFFTVDQYNDEFSRDIEPVRNSTLKDNTYLLSHKQVRDYKLNDAKHYIHEKVTPSLDNPNDDMWAKGKTYLDFSGEAIKRDAYRFDGKMKYIDESNRNDIVSTTVVRDEQNLYFKIETLDNITAYKDGDKYWMNIFINTQNKRTKNALGYQYVINRSKVGNETTIMAATGEKTYEEVGKAEIRISGKYLTVKVPLSALNLSATNYDIEFKIADNVTSEKDVLDLYTTGDVAPIGRLNYKFGY